MRLKSVRLNSRCFPTLSGAPTLPGKGCACHDSCHLRLHTRCPRFTWAAPFAPDPPGRLAQRLDCCRRRLRNPKRLAARAAHQGPLWPPGGLALRSGVSWIVVNEPLTDVVRLGKTGPIPRGAIWGEGIGG